MSQEIICRECHTRNVLGSKFCNNCGTRLPAATKIICPNCETPNPQNRFYCDNCGTRLIQDELPKQDPPPSEPPTGADKIFSLPIRPPGDTGELDAKQTIPDWLKGQTDSTDEEVTAESPRRNMPKIEDVGSAKKMTDDLPDWLVDEHDSNPVLGSPRVITTEHYLRKQINSFQINYHNETRFGETVQLFFSDAKENSSQNLVEGKIESSGAVAFRARLTWGEYRGSVSNDR